jgi:SAM-dependent methyltransferase
MDQPPRPRPDVDPARAFDLMADSYDRARPTYPEDAVSWLLAGVEDTEGTRVLELGAGTGKLTQQLAARGCRVVATDPSEAMLARLGAGAPHVVRIAATAEQLPLVPRVCDLLVAAQAFHWFDAPTILEQAVRVLRPGGRLAVLWSSRDERVPWVRRLGRIIGTPQQRDDPTEAIDESAMFETVERATFRFWQPLTRESLRDLVSSRSHVALMSDPERERVLDRVDELYAEYGRGADGMLLPYVTTACRATVLPRALPQQPGTPAGSGSLPGGHADGPDGPGGHGGVMDDDALLIDFR